jgi:hypothetical protein
MHLQLLYAFLWCQGAIGFGIAAFFFAMHIVPPASQLSPRARDYLNRYPAWRRKLFRVYPLSACLTMVLGVVVCVICAGINAYAAARPDASYAYLTDFASMMQVATFIFACQALIIILLFLQLWRGRRGIRKLARVAIRQQQAGSENGGQPASAATQLAPSHESMRRGIAARMANSRPSSEPRSRHSAVNSLRATMC